MPNGDSHLLDQLIRFLADSILVLLGLTIKVAVFGLVSLCIAIVISYAFRVPIEILAIATTDISNLSVYLDNLIWRKAEGDAKVLLVTNNITVLIAFILTCLVFIKLSGLLYKVGTSDQRRVRREDKRMFDGLLESAFMHIGLYVLLFTTCSFIGLLIGDIYTMLPQHFSASLPENKSNIPIVFNSGSISSWSKYGIDSIVQPLLLSVPKDLGLSYSLIKGDSTAGNIFLLTVRLIVEFGFIRLVLNRLKKIEIY